MRGKHKRARAGPTENTATEQASSSSMVNNNASAEGAGSTGQQIERPENEQPFAQQNTNLENTHTQLAGLVTSLEGSVEAQPRDPVAPATDGIKSEHSATNNQNIDSPGAPRAVSKNETDGPTESRAETKSMSELRDFDKRVNADFAGDPTRAKRVKLTHFTAMEPLDSEHDDDSDIMTYKRVVQRLDAAISQTKSRFREMVQTFKDPEDTKFVKAACNDMIKLRNEAMSDLYDSPSTL